MSLGGESGGVVGSGIGVISRNDRLGAGFGGFLLFRDFSRIDLPSGA